LIRNQNKMHHRKRLRPLLVQKFKKTAHGNKFVIFVFWRDLAVCKRWTAGLTCEPSVMLRLKSLDTSSPKVLLGRHPNAIQRHPVSPPR
jgi:hypothetical protein